LPILKIPRLRQTQSRSWQPFWRESSGISASLKGTKLLTLEKARRYMSRVTAINPSTVLPRFQIRSLVQQGVRLESKRVQLHRPVLHKCKLRIAYNPYFITVKKGIFMTSNPSKNTFQHSLSKVAVIRRSTRLFSDRPSEEALYLITAGLPRGGDF